jgi:hypothetical protein
MARKVGGVAAQGGEPPGEMGAAPGAPTHANRRQRWLARLVFSVAAALGAADENLAVGGGFERVRGVGDVAGQQRGGGGWAAARLVPGKEGRGCRGDAPGGG